MKIQYASLNHSSTLQMKRSLYTAIIRPLLTRTHASMGAQAVVTRTKIKKLQTLQNKFLIMSLKAPAGFMRNKQLHNDTGLPYLSTCVVNQWGKLPRQTEQNRRKHSTSKSAKNLRTAIICLKIFF